MKTRGCWGGLWVSALALVACDKVVGDNFFVTSKGADGGSACVPDQARCTGTLLERCTSLLQWETAQTCSTQALRDAVSGRCNEPTCQVSDRR